MLLFVQHNSPGQFLVHSGLIVIESWTICDLDANAIHRMQYIRVSMQLTQCGGSSRLGSMKKRELHVVSVYV